MAGEANWTRGGGDIIRGSAFLVQDVRGDTFSGSIKFEGGEEISLEEEEGGKQVVKVVEEGGESGEGGGERKIMKEPLRYVRDSTI